MYGIAATQRVTIGAVSRIGDISKKPVRQSEHGTIIEGVENELRDERCGFI